MLKFVKFVFVNSVPTTLVVSLALTNSVLFGKSPSIVHLRALRVLGEMILFIHE